jgi:hypothetical protein
MTPDLLIAVTPGGRVVSITLATPAEVASGFVRAHELSGRTVQRLSPAEGRQRFARRDVAPVSPDLGRSEPTAPVLPPPPGTRVRAPLGEGVVRHHLTYPDRVVAVVRGDRGRFESLVATDQLVVLPAPVAVEPTPPPPVALRLALMPDGPACGRCDHALPYNPVLIECDLGWAPHDRLGSNQRRGDGRRDFVAPHGELLRPLLTPTHHCVAQIAGRAAYVTRRAP